ncbi:hypothetical protein P7A58_15410, partial [Clostridium perfringens]|nr:hypothetical protein [Clostridium perfringens]
IFSKKKEFLFSLSPNPNQLASEKESQLLLFLLLGSISLWLFAFLHFTKALTKSYRWIIPTAIVGLRILSLRFEWFGFMHETHAFQASLYGTNEWF